MGPADAVWNRACFEAGGPKTLSAPGDRALADMIVAHSVAMNGGVLHAVEALSPGEIAAAVRGFRYFGLDGAAAVFEDIHGRLAGGHVDDGANDRLEREADERYDAVVPGDHVLVIAFEARYEAEPGEFAPLD